MTSSVLELNVVPQPDGSYSETAYGDAPHGYVQSFRLDDQEPIISSRVTGETVSVTTTLPTANAEAIAAYWQLYGDKPSYRNCHSFAHIVGRLVTADTLSHNLIDTVRLLIDPRDAGAEPADPFDLVAGGVYAVTDRHMGHSAHSLLALAGMGLILDVNGSGGDMRLGSAQQRIQGYRGTGIHRLHHPSPALGTDYWMTGRLDPVDDPRHIDVIIAEQRAQEQPASHTQVPGYLARMRKILRK